MSYRSIKVATQDQVCFLQLNRPDAKNTINREMVEECLDVLAMCEQKMTVLVLEGSSDVFCFGADFKGISESAGRNTTQEESPDALYELWTRLAAGSFVSVAHVRGRTNAGGVGFVAASDIVLASNDAQFSLSEMLFGILPACVLPFLIRRTGPQKAGYLTLMTKPIDAEQARQWGLVDACGADSRSLLQSHLQRLRRLTKASVRRYKRYAYELDRTIEASRATAVARNLEVFKDADVVHNIHRYVASGKFPWESD